MFNWFKIATHDRMRGVRERYDKMISVYEFGDKINYLGQEVTVTGFSMSEYWGPHIGEVPKVGIEVKWIGKDGVFQEAFIPERELELIKKPNN